MKSSTTSELKGNIVTLMIAPIKDLISPLNEPLHINLFFEFVSAAIETQPLVRMATHLDLLQVL